MLLRSFTSLKSFSKQEKSEIYEELVSELGGSGQVSEEVSQADNDEDQTLSIGEDSSIQSDEETI